MDFVTKVLAILFGYVTLFYEVRGFQNDPRCGRSSYRSSKIIGGENAMKAEFPWFVSIKETGRYQCGGFIINQRSVITAAHCFKFFSDRAANSPSTISVTLDVGEQTKDSRKYKWELEVKVKKIMRHPKYDASSNSGKYDIALLLLEEDIQWNTGTRPVCLPTASKSDLDRASYIKSENFTNYLDFQNGEIAIVAGWPSKLSEETKDFGNTLQKINLTLYNNEECTRIFKEKNVTTKIDIDSTMICAGSKDMGVDSCSGDSGSALLIKKDQVWVAIGIVSSGVGQCGSGIPGIYTRIASYMEWIDLHNNQIASPIFFKKLRTFVQ